MAEEKDLIKDIEKVLDETIRPAMQNDGGDVSATAHLYSSSTMGFPFIIDLGDFIRVFY